MKNTYVILLLMAIITTSTVNLAIADNTKDKQTVFLTVSVHDSDGYPLNEFNVRLCLLSTEGVLELASGTTNTIGEFLTKIVIPRIYKTTIINRGQAKDYYAAINLMAEAYKENKDGVTIFSLYPAELDWPTDSYTVDIQPTDLSTLNKGVGILSGGSPPQPGYVDYQWKDTRVLEFATWTNISAKYNYPVGAYMKVESQIRYYNASSGQITSGWISAGSTTATLDTQRYSSYVSGKYIYGVIFQLRYQYRTEWVTPVDPKYSGYMAREVVALIDTGSDPNYNGFSTSSYDGYLPSGTSTYTGQLNGVVISVTGGTNYIWSLSIGFSVGTGYSISLSLGISAQPVAAPRGTIDYYAGTWTQGYRVKIVSQDGTWRYTKANWVPS